MDGKADRLVQVLAAYAAYHRDARNRATHWAGIPMIVFSLVLGLSLFSVPMAPPGLSPAVLASAALVLYYGRLDARLALSVAVVLALMVYLANSLVIARSAGFNLSLAGSLFVFGWVLQLTGHALEGRRPALVDNLAQIFTAPLFIAAETAFALGLRGGLQRAMHARLARLPDRQGAA